MREGNIYGRFDLVLDMKDGQLTPKLLEYNADTPTSLVESSLVSADWYLGHFSESDNMLQFNLVNDLLIDAWKNLRAKLLASKYTTDTLPPLYLSCIPNHEEDLRTIEYMAITAEEAGTNSN